MWEYESQPNNWVQVTDPRIEEFYHEWIKTGKEHSYVFSCFGNGATTGVNFADMETSCLALHKPTRGICDCHRQNSFKLRRVFKV